MVTPTYAVLKKMMRQVEQTGIARRSFDNLTLAMRSELRTVAHERGYSVVKIGDHVVVFPKRAKIEVIS